MTNTLAIIAAILIGEGGVDGPAGIHAVAEVIRNRAAYHRQHPLHVATKPRAFSSWRPSLPRRMQRSPAWPYAVTLAGLVLEAPHLLPDTVNGADHFDNVQLRGMPTWARGKRPVAKIGRQTFWKLHNSNK